MEIIGPLILSLISGFSTFIGIIPIFIKINRVENIISFSLSLSYFILLYICFFDLIPSSIKILFINYNYILSIIISILIFLLGYIIILILKRKEKGSSLYRIGIISLISIILHNIPEGLIVFISSYKSIKIGIKMLLAIILHNIPEGFLISIPLYYSNNNKKDVIIKMFFASISEPIGALLSIFVIGRGVNDLFLSYILLFVSGIMISLCFNEIFYELIKFKNKKGILIGFELSVILIIILSMLN